MTGLVGPPVLVVVGSSLIDSAGDKGYQAQTAVSRSCKVCIHPYFMLASHISLCPFLGRPPSKIPRKTVLHRVMMGDMTKRDQLARRHTDRALFEVVGLALPVACQGTASTHRPGQFPASKRSFHQKAEGVIIKQR